MADKSDPRYQAIYQKLQELARSKGITTYTEISDFGGLETRGQDLGDFLHEINRQEHDQGHPLLSALVTHGKGSMPGEGFFGSAKRLRIFEGIGTKERREFWLSERQRVFDCWAKVGSQVTKKKPPSGILKVTLPAKGRKWIYATIGAWQASVNTINVAFPGGKFLQVSNQPGSRLYQPLLFGALKESLEESGRWKK